MATFLKRFWDSFIEGFGSHAGGKAQDRVSARLEERENLTSEHWFQRWWKERGISKEVTDFLYEHAPDYFTFEIGRVVPSDRLREDLELKYTGYIDWDMDLWRDYRRTFNRKLGKDPAEIRTIEDFINWLQISARGD
jgi:hypothetical protein